MGRVACRLFFQHCCEDGACLGPIHWLFGDQGLLLNWGVWAPRASQGGCDEAGPLLGPWQGGPGGLQSAGRWPGRGRPPAVPALTRHILGASVLLVLQCLYFSWNETCVRFLATLF